MLNETQAIEEVIGFIEFHEDEKKTGDEVLKSKKQMVRAICDGFLAIDDEFTPVLKLKTPIKNDAGDVTIDTIEFKTRLKPSDARNISRGMDLSKDSLGYIQKCMAHLMKVKDVQGNNFPITELFLDKLSKYDYKVVEEVTQSFL